MPLFSFCRRWLRRNFLQKRARKATTGEGSNATPQAEIEFDGHRFRSEEHHRHFEVIKDWSFLKERWIQLAEREYTEFQAEVARRRWTQQIEPMAKYDPEVVMKF